jgi:sulfur transfer complex TusBCD TusB component (DsrH family)
MAITVGKSDEDREKEFTQTFDQIKDEPATPQDGPEVDATTRARAVTMAPFQSSLGLRMDDEWQQAEGEKIFSERRHLRDLRQYRGQYDPEIQSKIHPNRSKAYIRLTRTKVKTFDARMMDIQFPANDDKNWVIHPTPVPELDGPMIEALAAQLFKQTGEVPTADQVEEIVYKQADASAKAMEQEIADQLAEFDYRAVIRNVVHSGHIFGTGVLKGPLVKEISSKRWYRDKAGNWKQLVIKRIVPVAQFVPIWDIYPDASAKELKDARYIWQKHLFTKNRLTVLGKRSDFDGDAVEAFIAAYPDGNASYKDYEELLREMSTNSKSDGDTNPPKKEKYELHERWGFLPVEDAKELAPDVTSEVWDMMGPEVACNLWLLGDIVVKAVISPVEGADLPYYFYYFDKDETSIFGDGIPQIMRDPQMLYNASIRAMLDNAAISAGPIIEANIDLLADGEDPLELFPFRVFQRTGVGIDANQAAIRVTKLPSYTKEFLGLVEFFQETADESTTIPRSLHGSQNMSGANQTATGMSMLIGASNITLKDQVQFFDDGVTKKFIKSMYFWNMEFNGKENIKGDFNIVARGTKSLIAKEVKMEQINQFLALTNNEIDNQYIKRDVLLRELAEVFDLDRLGFVRSEAEVAVSQKQNADAAKQESDRALILEAMKAESSGHVPNAVAKTAQLFNIQLPGGATPEQAGETLQDRPIG